MKTYKVLDIDYFVRLVCIKQFGNYANNPFRLYIIYRTTDENHYPKEHKKLIAKYGDMESVLCHIKDMYLSGIQYRPIDDILAWNKDYCNARTYTV